MLNKTLMPLATFGLFIFLLCLSSLGRAEGIALQVSDPVISINDSKLLIEFDLDVDGQNQLRAMLRDGAVIALEIECVLKRKRGLWPNENIMTENYHSILRYDQLTREFILQLPGDVVSKRDRKLNRLFSEHWKHLSIAMQTIILSEQPPNSSYRLDLSISLRHKENPPWLEKNLLFMQDIVAGPDNKRLDFEF